MAENAIQVACPECGYEFQIPVSEALFPIIEGEISRRVNLQMQQDAAQIRTAAQKEADERNHSLVAAKDKLIADLRVEIDAMRRKVDSGAQILAGEVQELELESMLRAAFPADRISPVERGRNGGDILQEVVGTMGKSAGAILWESKATRAWSSSWIEKIKADVRDAKASIGVIATSAMPKGVDTFDRIDSVFVCSVRCVLPLAQVLRQVLLEIAVVRAANKHADGTAEKLFGYISGPQFRSRLATVVDASIGLQSDLNADKRSTSKRWARSQRHLDVLVQGIGTIYGELQGIAGAALPEVPGVAIDNGSEEREAS